MTWKLAREERLHPPLVLCATDAHEWKVSGPKINLEAMKVPVREKTLFFRGKAGMRYWFYKGRSVEC